MARPPIPNLDPAPMFPSPSSVYAAVNGGAQVPAPAAAVPPAQPQPQVHPPTPAISDDTPVYRAIFEPLFTNLRLRAWTGVTWGDLDLALIENAVAIARKTPAGTTTTVDVFWRRTTNALAMDRWNGFTAWNLWHRDVARSQAKVAIPRAWYIVSSYPGDDYMLPEQWINAARRDSIPWGRWRLYTALGSLGVLRNGPDLMDEAMSLEGKVGLDGVEALARGGGGGSTSSRSTPAQRSGKQQYADLPDAWASAVASLCLGVSQASAGVYRSRLRRIVEEAGQAGRAAPDLDACAITAARISPVYLTVWRRFVPILSEVEVEGLRRRRNTLFPHGRAAVFDAAEAKNELARASAAFRPHGDD